MVRSIRMPAAPRDHESERHGDRQRIVEQRRIVAADELLHDEGRVGAEHHHLAVRHVDDAHDAEGDGEADRREQQHRAEREAVPGVLHGVPDRQACSGSWRGGGGGRCTRGGCLAGTPSSSASASWSPRSRMTAMAAILSASARFVVGQHDGGARLAHRLLDARVVFRGQRLVQRRQRAGVARLENRLRRVVALAGVRRHQRQAAERRVDDAAQPVVDDDGVDVVGRRAGGTACRWRRRAACRPWS